MGMVKPLCLIITKSSLMMGEVFSFSIMSIQDIITKYKIIKTETKVNNIGD